MIRNSGHCSLYYLLVFLNKNKSILQFRNDLSFSQLIQTVVWTLPAPGARVTGQESSELHPVLLQLSDSWMVSCTAALFYIIMKEAALRYSVLLVYTLARSEQLFLCVCGLKHSVQ